LKFDDVTFLSFLLYFFNIPKRNNQVDSSPEIELVTQCDLFALSTYQERSHSNIDAH